MTAALLQPLFQFRNLCIALGDDFFAELNLILSPLVSVVLDLLYLFCQVADCSRRCMLGGNACGKPKDSQADYHCKSGLEERFHHENTSHNEYNPVRKLDRICPLNARSV